DAFYRACNDGLFFGTLSLRHFGNSLGRVLANFASFLSKPQIPLEPGNFRKIILVVAIYPVPGEK
ncbi:MAG: hypothetical protein NTW32_15765, partial [Chloroflexi bacterium]|nr:hypothetical protein [Chloroflexota bacterium]